jgi:cytochrome c oxidase cbb3-type subunit 3
MRRFVCRAVLVASGALMAAIATGQEGVQTQANHPNMTPEQRAASTRAFLGLGAVPDKEAAARAAPVFQRNCAFCHGPQGRGATGPSLVTSDEVLGDDHGEKLVLFLKKGRPDKGMPAFATMSDDKLKDLAEFMHLEVEEVANRGAYHVLNILVGDRAKGQDYVTAHCMSCHSAEIFAHLGSKFRSPEQLQRYWIWPARPANDAAIVTATVKTPEGVTLTGRVTQVSDFRLTLIDRSGQTHSIARKSGVEVEINDPLAVHQEMIMTLKNDDMHNVTAYLDSLK